MKSFSPKLLQSMTKMTPGKNNADNDCVQVPLIEVLMQKCDLMEL